MPKGHKFNQSIRAIQQTAVKTKEKERSGSNFVHPFIIVHDHDAHTRYSQ